MAGIPAVIGKAHVRNLFATRVPVPAFSGASVQAATPPWLSELSAPPALAQWASSFGDLKSCWNACTDPEWLVWLSARTCSLGEQRKQVVLCAAELTELAQRGGRDTDPRVTHAISLVQMWAGLEADAPDLLAAECDALDAARESEQAADREAQRALTLFQSAPRRRPGSSGMSRALNAWQGWREEERGNCLALAAASVVRAAALADDPIVTAGEWAGCVSQSAVFAPRAMSARHPSGGHAEQSVTRKCVRVARRRLAFS